MNFENQPSDTYGAVLSPHTLSQFLAVESWNFLGDQRGGKVWRSPTGEGDRPTTVFLPWDDAFVDFSKRLNEAIAGIGDYFHLNLPDLAERVAAAHADIFHVRVDQPMLDGTIPLSQATGLLRGIEKMIKAAATTAVSPEHSHRGRLPKSVTDFMSQDVRMGHTKSGSFIVTVVARLDSLDDSHAPLGQTQGQVEDQTVYTEEIQPFARQVMTTLSNGLDAARRHVQSEAIDFLDLDAAVEQGVSLPLIQALHEIGSAENLRSLDLSFDWSPAAPEPLAAPSRILMDKPELEALSEVSTRLERRIEPAVETIMGQVQSLERAEHSEIDENNGVAVISTEVRGNFRRVHVPLSGSDYDWAIVAHHRKLVFTVSGTLEKVGRNWTLTGDVHPDLSFLQHVMKSNIAPPSLIDDIRQGEIE
ncbi:hypothetical protein [Paenarthrobacter nicotinovorans]|uniref:hypothetical protein n=1 Tax=Paenarthrobacter nicotinovorans TaxID=29320 RepID=UPI003A8096B1